MDWRELLHRTGQYLQTQSQRKKMGTRPDTPPCIVTPGILPGLRTRPDMTMQFDILGIAIDLEKIDNWSLDVFTQRTFPACFAKDINIRTDEHGSAKHVWELNRMLFLPRLALLYRQTSDPGHLALIMRLLSSWAEQNPYLTGINWYSNIEVNIRLINWFLTWEILQPEQLQQPEPGLQEFITATWIPLIYQHCKFSYAHPSLHSSANNHLIAEYAGLFIASSKWVFANSSGRWNAYAREGLEREIVRQHSSNGINREEAAEYIQFITDFLLLPMLAGDRTGQPFSASYKAVFRKILLYIRELLTIQGQFPPYGDKDDGRVFALNKDQHDNNFLSLLEAGSIYFNDPDLATGCSGPDQKNRILFGAAAATSLALRQPEGRLRASKCFPQEGHFIFRKQEQGDREIYCHFDAAPLGYLSIAAHGHADALSFVLYVDGQPVFVDPGSYCYHTHPEWRRYFVSTRAHNTICIDGLDQARFIGPTLWHHHYRTTVKAYGVSDDHDYVVASHNGYKKLHISHSRKLEFFRKANMIFITDHISNHAGKPVELEMPFHLHPDTGYSLEPGLATLTTTSRNVRMQLDGQLQWKVVTAAAAPRLGWYSESFYKKTASPVIVGSCQVNRSLILQTTLQIHSHFNQSI